jgi:hypothetical protein
MWYTYSSITLHVLYGVRAYAMFSIYAATWYRHGVVLFEAGVSLQSMLTECSLFS